MSEKHMVVQGAVCKCNLSVEPKTDILKVKSQSKHFANDKEGSEKLLATTKEVGKTLEKNTFGKCKKQPSGNDYLPCIVQITNKGKILLEDSKATCAMGAPDCIEIIDHGQISEPSKQNFKKADPDVQNKINPLLDLNGVDRPKFDFNGIEQK